ncbi:MAG: hypothetical protein ACK5V3_16595 [Bdellovibrionales bacterium]
MSEPVKRHRYKHAEGKRWIEVRVKSAQQLFDARDPAPFRDRDLDDDFVEWINSSAREFPIKTPLKIVIHVEEAEKSELSSEAIREAIRSFYAYKIELQRGDLKDFIRRAQIFFAVGILVLVACLAVAQSLPHSEPPGALNILREGLVIFGWVSIWKPIELILFDWYPLFERLRLFKKLENTEIDFKFQKESAHPV